MSQDTKQSAIEAAAMLAETTVSRNGHEMNMPEADMRHIWESAKRSGLARVQMAKYRLFLKAWLAALVEDEGAVEAIGKAMLADELSARPRRDFDQTWAEEDLIWLSNARAAIRTLLTRAQGESS